jgi:8-hydroxy-5-deazaflavin:NADPH oxidoreductase
MRVGVLGAGHLGGTLARQLVAAGHEVAVANSRGPQSLRPLAERLGGHTHPMAAVDAARFGEMLILALPFGRVGEVPADETRGKVVVDATNYQPERDGHLAPLDLDTTTSTEAVQAQLPGARVVKAFNTMRWEHLRDFGHCGGSEMRYGMPVAGDDPAAKRAVFDLVEQLGFEPVDAGGLGSGGRRQQPGGDLYEADLPADTLHIRLGAD